MQRWKNNLFNAISPIPPLRQHFVRICKICPEFWREGVLCRRWTSNGEWEEKCAKKLDKEDTDFNDNYCSNYLSFLTFRRWIKLVFYFYYSCVDDMELNKWNDKLPYILVRLLTGKGGLAIMYEKNPYVFFKNSLVIIHDDLLEFNMMIILVTHIT